MSDISLLSILSGAQGTGLEGASAPVKGEQAKVSLAEIDPELLKSLSPELKKSLENSELELADNAQELPDFESLLSAEKETKGEAQTKENLEALLNPKTGATKISTSEQSPVDVKGQSKIKSLNTATDTVTLETSTNQATTEAALSVEQGKQAASKPQLKLISGEEFVEQKNVSAKGSELKNEMAIKQKAESELSELQVKELATKQEAIKTAAPKQAHNPFLAQSMQAKGALALTGAMFRDAVAAGEQKSEKEVKSKIAGIDSISSEQMVMDQTMGASAKAPVNESQAAAKPVLDMSHIDAKKAGDLINEITNYIDRSRLESKGEIDVWVHHKDLGTFQVQASKGSGMGANPVDLRIETFTQEGQQFFNQNAPELVKHLQDAGVKVSDFQLKTSLQSSLSQTEGQNLSQGQKDSGQNSHSQQQPGQMSQNSHDGRGEAGSDRRKQMWQHYQETYRQRFAS